MNQFNPWRRDNKYQTLTQALLMAVLPLLCSFVRCALDGEVLSNVWLPASEWNDELFYFKQVEAILRCGFPQGYFGFNESHALKLSFAAWSPVLAFPWILWGLVFGWNLWSPVVCNIVLTSVVFFLFVWLVKPAWKQLGVLALLFALYRPFTRYMLSGMAEVICFDMVLLFYAAAWNYLKNKKVFKLVLLFFLAALMTLMRPYFVLFFLLPAYLWLRRSGWPGVAGSAAALGVTLGIYAAMTHYLGAEYFEPLYFTDWVDAFFERGIWGGARYSIGKLYYMVKALFAEAVRGFQTGAPIGAYFCGHMTVLGVLAAQSALDFWKFKALGRAAADRAVRNEEEVALRRSLYNRLIIQGHLTFCFAVMLVALLMMYKLDEGSRHLLTFVTAGIFVIGLMDTKYFKKAALVGSLFAYLYAYMAKDPLYFALPYRQEAKVEQFLAWEEIFSEKLEIDKALPVPNYDNSVIWVFQDEAPDGSMKLTRWQFLYSLPEGFGINCCKREFIVENFGRLQSKYLATLSGGKIDEMCRKAEYPEIGRDRDLVIYRLR